MKRWRDEMDMLLHCCCFCITQKKYKAGLMALEQEKQLTVAAVFAKKCR